MSGVDPDGPRDASTGRRERYSEPAVRHAFALVRWLHAHHLSNPVYWGVGAAMIPAYLLLVNVLNRCTVLGRDRLPEGGFFLLCNHISMLDGQVIGTATFPRPYWYPSKASFYTNHATALAYTALTAFKSFPVRRGERDMRAIEHMEDLLRGGESILLFPEGTRSTDGTLGRGKVGVGKIVHDARPVVVPAYVEGFDQILARGRLLPRVGRRSYLLFGHPLEMSDLYEREPGRETSQMIVDRVMEGIAALRDELHAHPDYRPG